LVYARDPERRGVTFGLLPPTPCQKCKAELAEGRELVRESTEKLLRAAERIFELEEHVRRLEAQPAHKHQGARGYPCPRCQVMLSVCDQHGPYVRTDENQCGACRRGE
jgi:hypothetical protein